MEITRQALYEALWSSPRKELASAWGIDPNTITYASKKQNIPLPKPGHWTLVSMGKSPTQPTLIGNPDESVTLEDPPRKPRNKKQPSSGTAKAATKGALTSGPTPVGSSNSVPASIHPVTSISEALPTVRKAYKTYSSPKAVRDYKYQHVLPGSAEVIRIAVMPEMVERALLLMDTILREFQMHHLRIPANVTGHSGDRDRFAHGHHAGVDFVL